MIYEFVSVVFQSLVSIFACAVYIVSLYREPDLDPTTPFNRVELVTAVLILIDYINGFFLSNSKRKYILNLLNIVDLLTVIPIILSNVWSDFSGVANLSFARIWRFVRFLRFFRIYKILKRMNSNDIKSISSTDPVDVKRKLFTIFIQMLALVFISASIILTLSDMIPEYFKIKMPLDDEELTFDSALYFVLITITTVGYGDMSPDSTLSRIIVGIFFIGAVVFFTMQTSEISDLLKQSSSFNKPFKRKTNTHVILTSSSFNDLKLMRFLREFYHKDHGDK